MNRLVLPLLLLCIFSTAGYAQPVQQEFQMTATLIRDNDPIIKLQTLEKDASKIKLSFKTIEDKYKLLGYSEADASAAVLLGWKQVRLDSPLQASKTIDTESFVAYMTEEFFTRNGKIEVFSIPEGGKIFINGVEVGVTRVKKFYPIENDLNVRCEKDGFAGTTACPVKAGSNQCECKMDPVGNGN